MRTNAGFAEAVRELRRADPVLGEVIRRVGACAFAARRVTPFEGLVRAIVNQQLSVKAGATILSRVVAAFDPTGRRFPTPEELLAASDETLRAAGLSRNKVASIRDLASKTLDGTVPDRRRMARMKDDTLVEHLTQVRGVGVWTAEVLLFSMGRPDVLPAGDLVLRRNVAVAYELPAMPTEEALRLMGETWRPWRSIAAWYLWRAG